MYYSGKLSEMQPLPAFRYPEACRFVNDVLQRGKRRKDEFGRAPVEGAHGEIVVFSIPDSKLFLEVLEGKEFV